MRNSSCRTPSWSFCCWGVACFFSWLPPSFCCFAMVCNIFSWQPCFFILDHNICFCVVMLCKMFFFTRQDLFFVAMQYLCWFLIDNHVCFLDRNVFFFVFWLVCFPNHHHQSSSLFHHQSSSSFINHHLRCFILRVFLQWSQCSGFLSSLFLLCSIIALCICVYI